jgi:hypothetical protein
MIELLQTKYNCQGNRIFGKQVFIMKKLLPAVKITGFGVEQNVKSRGLATKLLNITK